MIVLNVGSGGMAQDSLPPCFQSPGWDMKTYDIDPGAMPDYLGSIVDMNTVPNDSMDAVFGAHVLEHIFEHEVLTALNEFIRIINDTGFVIMQVPDIELAAKMIAEGRPCDALYHTEYSKIRPMDIVYGSSIEISHGKNFMAHRTGFTQWILETFMRKANFSWFDVLKHQFDLWAIGGRGPRPEHPIQLK